MRRNGNDGAHHDRPVSHRWSHGGRDTTIRPFRIDVPEEELIELRRRIQATRWPEQETVADASNTGVSSGRL
jgi:Epoxide hydrolase N terminus